MFAAIDMTENCVAAIVILVVATIILYKKSPKLSKAQDRGKIWIWPLVALVSGPLLALSYWALDVFLLYPDHYPLPSDKWAVFRPVLTIGAVTGGVCALVFYFVQSLKSFFGTAPKDFSPYNS